MNLGVSEIVLWKRLWLISLATAIVSICILSYDTYLIATTSQRLSFLENNHALKSGAITLGSLAIYMSTLKKYKKVKFSKNV